MKRLLSATLFSLSLLGASAADLEPTIVITPPSREFFKGEQFAKQFAGTYKFISDTEPKVEQDEKDILLKLQEMFEKGQTKQAENELRAFMDLRTAEGREVSPALVFTLATMYFQKGNLAKGEELYKIAIKRHPDFRRAHKNLAFLYLSKGDFEAAFTPLQRSIQLGDADHRSFGMLGYIYLKREDFIASENAYRQAVLLNPTEKDWKVGLVQTLMSMENYVGAQSLLNSMIKNDPENTQFQALLANAYLGQGETMKAAEVFEALRLRDRITPQQLEMIGNIYLDQGLNTLALGSYMEALKSSKDFKVSRGIKTARILADYGEPDAAATYLAEVEKKGGTKLTEAQQADVLLVKVKIAKAQNDTAEVKHLYRETLKLQPDNGKVMTDLAKALDNEARDMADEEAAQKQTAEAIALLNTAKVSKDPEVQYLSELRLGQLQVARQKYIEAIKHIDQAIKIREADRGPNSADGLKAYARSVRLRAKYEQKKLDAANELADKRRKVIQSRIDSEEAAKTDKSAEAPAN